ncbi:MAG: RNA polymerase sigma factor RpoD/SigA [bacterium]
MSDLLQSIPMSAEQPFFDCESNGGLPCLKNIPVLGREEEKKLFMALKANPGDLGIRQKIAYHNLRLVAYWVIRIMNSRQTWLEMSDLFQCGYLGLEKALDKFDIDKGFRFSTFASWGIIQGIEREIDNHDGAPRVPVHVREQINRYAKISAEIRQETGRRPNVDEVARQMNCSAEDVKKLQGFYALKRDQLSLDMIVPSEEGKDSATFGDTLPTSLLGEGREDTQDPQDIAERNILWTQILKTFESLNPREREIMFLRHGIQDGRPRTLEEVGDIFKVTRERIRQIEIKAVKKISLRID